METHPPLCVFTPGVLSQPFDSPQPGCREGNAEKRAHTPARAPARRVGPRQPQQTLGAALSVRSGGGRTQTVVMPQLQEYTAALLPPVFASQLHFFWAFDSLAAGEEEQRRQPCVMARLCALSPEL
ncbi:hypothetical protein FQA47_004075 [Oryzias melastigma]|uniref:Uncharacterized protein n=1 Tax=Oryzias melastigma TaxID=30732 RepID=A0A834CM21_ORYME|nr:hypothetical protein FQA47_004075 [Oryzias melastigma]